MLPCEEKFIKTCKTSYLQTSIKRQSIFFLMFSQNCFQEYPGCTAKRINWAYFSTLYLAKIKIVFVFSVYTLVITFQTSGTKYLK